MITIVKASMRIVVLLLFGFLLLQSCTQYSKTVDQHTPDFHLIDSLFNAALENHEMPAAAAYISYKGEEVYQKAYGWKNIDAEKELVVSDMFRIASMTKSVTATAIMQLVERGLMKLDDPVSKYIPEFKDPQVLIEVLPDSSFTARPAVREITIKHLLTHNAGIGYGFQSDTYNALVIKNGITEGFEERPIENLENARRIAKLPLLHDPGDDFTYSLSFDVLGAVVEIVSGERLDHYFSRHIFQPLGMNDTYFYLPDEKKDRLVTVYEHNSAKDGFIKATYPMTEYPVAGAQTYLSGGGDLSSTVKDIGTYAMLLLKGGKLGSIRILGEEYVKMMKSNQSEHGWWDMQTGFGVSLTTKAGAVVKPQSEGSFEFGGFFDTFCWVDPPNELIAVLFLQMYPNNEFDVHYKFRTLVYKGIQK